MKKALFATLVLGLATAYAGSSYRVTLYRSTVVNGTELKAGDCKVELHDNKIVLKQGKTTAESAVKVETSAQKYLSTSVGYTGEGSGNELQELRLGGTTTKVIFDQAATAVAGSK
jgi:hypothetical protein